MNRYALLVGINEYRDKAFTSLRFAERDAEELALELESHCGFRTRVLTGECATRKAIERVLETSRLTAEGPEMKPNDLFVFFFAGHGQTLPRDSRYVLHPHDAEADSSLESITMGRLMELVELRVRAGQCICLLDACRNSAPRGGRGAAVLDDLGARDISTSVRKVRSKRMRFLFACSEGERSWEVEELEHGVFTHSLLATLRDRPAQAGLTYNRLIHEAGRRMRVITTPGGVGAQEPWQLGGTDDFELVSLTVADSGELKREATPSRQTLPQPQLVECPACGRRNEPKDAFRCRECGRDNLCLDHFDKSAKECDECSKEHAEARRRAEQEESRRRAEEETRRRAEEEEEARRKAEEEEAWRKAEEKERRRRATEDVFRRADEAIRRLTQQEKRVDEGWKAGVRREKEGLSREAEEEAPTRLRKIADQDDVDAQFCEPYRDELEYAVERYRKAAEQGDMEAQWSLGRCYAHGRGVDQDYEEAIRWYRKAAEQGEVFSQFYLGDYYAEGKVVPQDKAEAARWYRMAAEHGGEALKLARSKLDSLEGG